jgi:EAL domain-containing protein (putative c-di-GMP-specific phosphodiesterase class I)
VAVDDAGAGVANFGHIIELRPDFVKLDISLVRGVNANLGRQAMVVGMRHFSRAAGCRLVAEGVETPEEAAMLTSLGVEFGQGYLFGRPEPVDAWAPAAPRPSWLHDPTQTTEQSGDMAARVASAQG